MPDIALSPALALTEIGEGEVTTATFNPPAQSLIAVGIVAAEAITGVSGGGLTWTVRVQRSTSGQVEWWTAPNLSAQTGVTVTVSAPGGIFAAHIAAKAYVLTGVDLTNPVGATGNNSTTTNNATVTGYTSTRSESRGLIAALDASGQGLPTSTDDEVAFSGDLDGLIAVKSLDTPLAGTGVTFNLDAGGSGAASWQWAAIEIQPPPVAVVSRPAIPKAAVHRAASF